jgi:hypothetical protein
MSEELTNDFRVAEYHRPGVVEAEKVIKLLNDSQDVLVFSDARDHSSND